LRRETFHLLVELVLVKDWTGLDKQQQSRPSRPLGAHNHQIVHEHKKTNLTSVYLQWEEVAGTRPIGGFASGSYQDLHCLIMACCVFENHWWSGGRNHTELHKHGNRDFNWWGQKKKTKKKH